MERSVVDELERAGLTAIHRPLLALHAAGLFDEAALMAVALARPGLSVAAGDVGALSGNAGGWRPQRAFAFREGGAVAGVAPLSPRSWAECAGGAMDLHTTAVTPEVVAAAMPGRLLDEIAEFEPFSGEGYRIRKASIRDVRFGSRGHPVPLLRIECVVPIVLLCDVVLPRTLQRTR